MAEVNTIIFLSAFGIFIFFLSYYITSYVRNYSLRNNVIDIPNERSSHVIPTPTGGGLAISISILLSILLFSGTENSLSSSSLSLGLGLGVLVIGVVGWIDIHREIAVLTRAILYLLASVWAVLLLGGMKTISLGYFHIELGWLGTVIAIVAVSWLVNLYNFMDGTDGLAAVEALGAGFYGAIFFFFSGHYEAGVICLTIIFSTSGFLMWNWTPAKIFMGDVGSCSIGFTFGVLAVYGEVTNAMPAIIWLVLLSIFISDASFTLLKRVIYSENWYRAHNTHAYQRLVQLGIGHDRLAMYAFYINIFLLGPLAYYVENTPEYALYILVALYTVLGICWLLVHRSFYKKTMLSTD